jgi:hypothetical protein
LLTLLLSGKKEKMRLRAEAERGSGGADDGAKNPRMRKLFSEGVFFFSLSGFVFATPLFFNA